MIRVGFHGTTCLGSVLDQNSTSIAETGLSAQTTTGVGIAHTLTQSCSHSEPLESFYYGNNSGENTKVATSLAGRTCVTAPPSSWLLLCLISM